MAYINIYFFRYLFVFCKMGKEYITRSHYDEQQAHTSANGEMNSSIKKILFVDDEDDDKLLFDEAMKEINNSFELFFAANGDELFLSLAEIMPDLIFLDIHMPGKSGIGCLKMLRYQPRFDHTPIIIYSRLSNQSFINDCYVSKANYYIIKPVTFSKITIAMHRILSVNWNAPRYPLKEDFVIR